MRIQSKIRFLKITTICSFVLTILLWIILWQFFVTPYYTLEEVNKSMIYLEELQLLSVSNLEDEGYWSKYANSLEFTFSQINDQRNKDLIYIKNKIKKDITDLKRTYVTYKEETQKAETSEKKYRVRLSFSRELTFKLQMIRLSVNQYTNIITKQAQNFAERATVIFITGLLLFGTFVIFILQLIRKSLGQPLQNLYQGMKFAKKGNLSFQIEIVSKDEIGEMSEEFNSMINSLNNAEEDKKESLEKLFKSNQDLQNFAYITSHDLREPLRTVSNFCQLLNRRYESLFDESAREYMDYILSGCHRMQELLNGILILARVVTQAKPAETVQIETILKEVTDSLKTLIEESSTKITYYLEQPTVKVYPSHLSQLLQNLIDNSIKFRREGVPSIIEIKTIMDKELCLFSVKDNGIGIPKEFYPKIFTIFQQLHKRGKYVGTGIGLAICKRIVEYYGCTIWFTSIEGEGTTFYFTLPTE